MKKLALSLLAAIVALTTASAQIYVADTFVSDHILATDNESFNYESLRLKGTIGAMHDKGHKVVEIPNGSEVSFIKLTREPSHQAKYNENLTVKIKYNGEVLYCFARDLKFSEKNPKGVKDALADIDFSPHSIDIKYKDSDGNEKTALINTLDRHSDEAKVLYSYRYPIAAAIFLTVAYLFLGICFLLRKKDSEGRKTLRYIFLMIAGVALMAMIFVEGKLYLKLGRELTWWFDPAYFHRGACIVRCIPFVVFAILQVISGFMFAELLPARKANKPASSIPALISVLVGFIPALIISYKVLMKSLGIDVDTATFDQVSQLFKYILLVVPAILALVPMIIYTVRCGLIGIPTGIFLTAYWIGTAVIGLVVVRTIIRLAFVIIAPLLVGIATAVGIGIAASAVGGGKSGSGSGGGSGFTSQPKPETYWEDADGHRHTNEVDAREANKRIAERKANES